VHLLRIAPDSWIFQPQCSQIPWVPGKNRTVAKGARAWTRRFGTAIPAAWAYSQKSRVRG
jgi:hypothetical protein